MDVQVFRSRARFSARCRGFEPCLADDKWGADSAIPHLSLGVVREQNAHLGEVRGGRARKSMQAMPSIVEADRRCHHASGDAQMGRLFPDDSLLARVHLEMACFAEIGGKCGRTLNSFQRTSFECPFGNAPGARSRRPIDAGVHRYAEERGRKATPQIGYFRTGTG